MYRIVDHALLTWRSSQRRKPLIVRGARQVGKTWSVRAFGRAQFSELAEVDLERNRDWHRIFEPDLDPRRILGELSVVLDREIRPGQTLLFLDEIQAAPRALMALRYLYEEVPDLHVIAAGSLLDFALAKVSFPVGRVQFLDLFPLTFAEFLVAIGRSKAAEIVVSPPGPVPESLHHLLLAQLRTYFLVGGMPESVAAYAETGTIRAAFEVQRELCESFRQDFARYAPRADPYCLDAVLTGLARHAGQQVKYTRLAHGWSGPTIKKAVDLLSKARVVRRVSAASPVGLPLGATASARKFKPLMVDVGLLQHLRGLRAEFALAERDLLAIHEGALAEQFVGQEMCVSQQSELHYWAREARGSTAEVDYLAVVDGTILPVEVKAGAAGRLRSLHLLLERFPECPRGLVFSSRPYAELPEQRLTFVPLYGAYAATGGTGVLSSSLRTDP